MLALSTTPSTCQKCDRVSSDDRPIAANTRRRSRITTGIATEKSACAANTPTKQKNRPASSREPDEHRDSDHREEPAGRGTGGLTGRLGEADVLVGDDARRHRRDERMREHADHEHDERSRPARRGSSSAAGSRSR